MKRLDIEPVLGALPSSTRTAAGRLSLRVSPDDGMYDGGDSHYLGCGASALNVILSALQVAGVSEPASVLDFGAGAGRVTRWLRAAFPAAAIAACDLRAQDMDFCKDEFQAETWVSGTDVAALVAPGRYDLIWVGSVLTHLSAETSARLVDKLLSWTHPGGIVVMSTIGRTAKALRNHDTHAYIHEEGWVEVVRDYDRTGMGYADYEGTPGYGLSLTRLSWTAGLVESLPGTRLVLLAEAAWDGLHDIVVIQNTDPAPRRTDGTGGPAERFAKQRNAKFFSPGPLSASLRFAARLVGR